MHGSSLYRLDDAANRCAICGRKFGLLRHYAWQTALCSSKCCEQSKVREKGDREWLSAGDHGNRISIPTSVCFKGAASQRS